MILLDAGTLTRLRNSAKVATQLEKKWDRATEELFLDITAWVLDSLASDAAFPQSLVHARIEEHLVKQSFEVAIAAARVAHGETELEKPAPTHRLAYPDIKLPKSLRALMDLYDRWKRGKYTPARPKKLADKIAKEYLKKVKDVWEKHSGPFREGKTASLADTAKAIRQVSGAESSRVQTIVRTETTSYYNQGRQAIYDESEDVTHYLFLAIRDKGTSPWCTPKTTNGKRGRHGLVYAKGDPLLELERPACHYNCRSEIVPLSPKNPSHLRLIQDASIQRRNVKCYPLLPGWRAS